MDPISLIVAALAAGATAGLKDTATQAIKDAYEGLKQLVTQRYSGVSTAGIEKKPESEKQQDAVKETLIDAGAATDSELVAAAKVLLNAVASDDPAAFTALGIDLERVKAAGDIDVYVDNVAPGAMGARATDVDAGGHIRMTARNIGNSGPVGP